MSTWSEVSTDEVAQPDRLALWPTPVAAARTKQVRRQCGRALPRQNGSQRLGGLKLCRLSAPSPRRTHARPDQAGQQGLLKMVSDRGFRLV